MHGLHAFKGTRTGAPQMGCLHLAPTLWCLTKLHHLASSHAKVDSTACLAPYGMHQPPSSCACFASPFFSPLPTPEVVCSKQIDHASCIVATKMLALA